jgi:hypothetical protein
MVELPFEEGDSVRVFVGDRAGRPYDGKWYVTYNGVSSEYIPSNAFAPELERILNTTYTISNEGGVSVVQLNRDIYKVTFLMKGARTALTGNGVSLFPSGTVTFSQVQAGTATDYAVYSIMLRQTALASLTEMEAEDDCVAMVQELKPDTWDVYLTSDAKDGYFTMAIDDDEPIRVSVFEDYSTFKTLVGAGFTVQRVGDFRWRIVKLNGESFTPSIVSSSEIISFGGVVGTIAVESQEAVEFLSGRAYSETTLEVVRDYSGGRETLVQARCRLQNKVYE